MRNKVLKKGRNETLSTKEMSTVMKMLKSSDVDNNVLALGVLCSNRRAPRSYKYRLVSALHSITSKVRSEEGTELVKSTKEIYNLFTFEKSIQRKKGAKRRQKSKKRRY